MYFILLLWSLLNAIAILSAIAIYTGCLQEVTVFRKADKVRKLVQPARGTDSPLDSVPDALARFPSRKPAPETD